MKKNSFPLVSVIVVNWNGKKYLQKCLSTLSDISYKNIEIIVVDQNSTDGSQNLVKKIFPKVILVENKNNTGYVGGNNLGAKRATGKYILILNNDIEVDTHFLEPLVDAFESDPKIGCVQPKAINLRFKGRLDGGGSFFTSTGFLYHKGYLENADNKEYNKRYPVYSVKGAYMMTRRSLFDLLGGLDDDFFIYFEESDYCARVWLSGHSVEYISKSIVYHWGAGDTSGDWKKKLALVQYRSFRNRICSYLKNLSLRKLMIVLPIHVVLSEGIGFYYLFIGQWRIFLALQRAIIWNIFHLKKTLSKRYIIQTKIRKVMDEKIFSIIEKKVTISYYWHLFGLLSKK